MTLKPLLPPPNSPVIYAAVPPPRSCALWALPPLSKFLTPLDLPDLATAAAATVSDPTTYAADSAVAAASDTAIAADATPELVPTAIYCYLFCVDYS